MPRDIDRTTEEETASRWSRRTVLKLTGGGVAAAGFAASGVALGQEDDEGDGEDGTGGENDEDGQADGDDSPFVDDLVDPTWGYPLAADETPEVDLDSVVEMVTTEGAGAHENFPPSPEGGEEMPFEFYFDPVGVHLEPGTVVKFVSTAGEHTATSFHEKFSNPFQQVPNRIPDAVPGFSSPPVVEGEGWLYQFTEKGVYDVLCLPHFPLGMVMRAVVYDPETDDIESETFAAPSGGDLPPAVQQVYGAPELSPSAIVDAGSVAWADLTLDGGGGGGGMGGDGGGGGQNGDGNDTDGGGGNGGA